MTFYTVDDTEFPIIKICLQGKITDKALNDFFDIWLSFYDRERKFYLLFDICNVRNPSIKNSFQLANFIKKIKKKSPQYLKKSLLILNDNFLLKKIMGLVFKITPPAAPLYLYWKKKEENDINVDTVREVYETKNHLFQEILP
jgi:hypothetical protein